MRRLALLHVASSKLQTVPVGAPVTALQLRWRNAGNVQLRVGDAARAPSISAENDELLGSHPAEVTLSASPVVKSKHRGHRRRLVVVGRYRDGTVPFAAQARAGISSGRSGPPPSRRLRKRSRSATRRSGASPATYAPAGPCPKRNGSQ